MCVGIKVKKPQKSSFLEWNNNVFVSSVKKIDLNIILIIFLDALFYIASGYLLIFWLRRIQEKIAAFSLPSDVMSLGYERAQQLAGDVKAFYLLIVLSFILVLIAVIFIASILKGIIWAKTTKTKITFSLISKFLGLNLIWMGFWLLMVFLVSYLAEPSAAPRLMIITILLGLYFTNTLYTLFMTEQKFKSVTKSIKFSFTKIKLLVLPYTIFFIFLFIMLNVSVITKLSQAVFSLLIRLYGFIGINANAISQFEIPIVLLVSLLANPLFLLSFAVFRYYISTLVLEAEKR